jgi:Ran GTPase-activating protein (RanGAP) involved in mRNA processing and transport
VNSSLQKLDLRTNYIEALGVTAISGALKVNSSLQELRLCSNQIGSSGAASIAEALMQNSTLQHLDLRLNSIGDAGAAAIDQSLECSILRLGQHLNGHFPEVLFEESLIRQHRFLFKLSEMGLRSFSMTYSMAACSW